MAQELEDLIIKVDSEIGDLKGIETAITALEGLSGFAQNAQKGAGSLKVMADALNTLDKYGKKTSGVGKVKEDVGDLIDILKHISSYTGKAREGIAQLSLLGKALKNFAGLGDKLKGLDVVSNSINGIIDAMNKLSGIGGSLGKTTSAVNDIKKAFDFSGATKKSQKDLKTFEKSVSDSAKARQNFFKNAREQRRNANAEIPLPKIQGMEKQLDKYRADYEKTIDKMQKAWDGIAFAKNMKGKTPTAFDISSDIQKGADSTSKALTSAIKKIKAQNSKLISGDKIELSNAFFGGFDIGKLDKSEREAILGIEKSQKKLFADASMSSKQMISRLKKQQLLDFAEQDESFRKNSKPSDMMPYEWLISRQNIKGAKFNKNPLASFVKESQQSLVELKPIASQLASKIAKIEQTIASAYEHNSNVRQSSLATPVKETISNTVTAVENGKKEIKDAVSKNPVSVSSDDLVNVDSDKRSLAELSALESWMKKRIAQFQKEIADATKGSSADTEYVDTLKGFLGDFEKELVNVQGRIAKFGNIKDGVNEVFAFDDAEKKLAGFSKSTESLFERIAKRIPVGELEQAKKEYEAELKEIIELMNQSEQAMSRIGFKNNGLSPIDSKGKKIPTGWEAQSRISETEADWKENYSDYLHASKMVEAIQKRIESKSGGAVFTEMAQGIDTSASSTDKFAEYMQNLANNANDAVSAVSKLSGFANAIDRLVSFKADLGVGGRNEEGLFANVSKGYYSKIIEGNKSNIPSNDIVKLYASLNESVDTFMHSHPDNIASFSPADIKSAFYMYTQGINNQILAGLKEVSTFDVSKINPSDFKVIYDSFNETLKKKTDELFTLSGQEIQKIFNVNSFAGEIFTNVEKAFKPQFLEKNFQSIKKIYDDFVNNASFGTLVDNEQLSSALSEQFIKGMGLNEGDIARFGDLIKSKLDEAFSNVYEKMNYMGDFGDKFQLLVRDSLKEALKNNKYDAEDIYKTFSADKFAEIAKSSSGVQQKSDLTKSIEQDNENLKSALDFREHLFEDYAMEDVSLNKREPKFTGSKFGRNRQTIAENQPTIETSPISDGLKLLNDFIDALNRLEGLTQKLEGIDKAVDGVQKFIDVLKLLSEYTGDASRSIEQFKALGEALQNFNGLGTGLEGIEGIHKGVVLMIDTLKMLSEYKGKASSAITQFGNLGKALQQFSELGKSLEGIESIYKGVDKMVTVLARLSEIEVPQKKTLTQLGSLGETLHSFNGLDANLSNLNEISVGLLNLSKATASMKDYSWKDFDYIIEIASALASFDGVLTGRQYTNVSNITSALAQLVTALKDTKKIDTQSIIEIGSAIGSAFNNDDFVKSANKIANVLENLYKAYGAIASQSGSVRDTMSLMVSSFKNASDALYDVRSNIEAISTDFTDALKPVTNSALFDTLKEFKKLNDSYKNVAGLGQGLGTLLDSLRQLKGSVVDISPLRKLLEDLEALSKEKDLTGLGTQFEKLTNMAQPVGILLNSLKYTDLEGSNKTLKTLASQLRTFYSDLPKGFDKISFTLNAIHRLIDLAKSDTGFDTENNAISALAETLKKFNDLKIPKLADFAQGIGQILEVLKKIPEGTYINTQPLTQLLDTLQYADSSMQNAQVILATVRSIGDVNKIETGKFKDLNEELNNLIMIFASVPTLDKNAFKGVSDVVKTLANVNLNDIDPQQLELVVDALAKLADHLANIQGSNNRITINVDTSGVAKLHKVVERTEEEYSRFARDVNEAIDNIDYTHMFDFEAPVGTLRKQLREAERMLHSTMKQMEKVRQDVDRSRITPTRVDILEKQETKYYQLRSTAISLTETIDRLHEAIANAPRFETYSEGIKYVSDLRKEYKQYEEVMKRYEGFDAPQGSQMGQMYEVIRLRMDEIKHELEESNDALKDMQISIEDVGDSARIAADEMTRMADESERASQNMRDSIGNGFGQFGSMLSGSGNQILSSFGNLSNMFGKAVQGGTAVMGDAQLASLQSLAGTLGTVATAVGQVGAVVGVVVAVIQTWWKLMNKVRDALIQFVQSLAQFAKNMLSKVVGAFNAVSGAVSKVVSAVKSGAEMVVSALQKIGQASGNVVSFFGKLGSAVAPAVKGIKSLMMAVSPSFVKTLVSSNFQLSKIIKQTHLLKNAIKSVQRYFSMLTRMIARKSITAFLNQMKQAFEDMVLFEKNADDAMLQLNYNVSIVFSALRRLANQVIAIFEPLVNALATPAETFLTTLTAMAENMAKTMAILTGQPYYLRAKKFYEDYGQNVDDTSKKVKDLTNGLDELNILSDKKDKDTQITPEMEFEKVYVDSDLLKFPSLKDIIDKIVDWLKNIDWQKIWDKIREFIHKAMEVINEILSRLDLWEWLGKTLGNLFNTLMVMWNQFIKDFDPKLLADAIATFIINALQTIDWDLIHENIELTAKKFAQFWNEIFGNKALWDEIAKLITNGLNEIVHYFDTWAWTFDFGQMAQTLTDTITSILKGFDYEQLRHAVEGWVKGIVDFINTAISNKEFWKTLGESLAKLLNSTIIEAFKDLGDIDFAGAVESLKLAIEKFLNGIDWNGFYEAIKKWSQNIADVINGLLADEQFLTTVTTNIAKFINGIIKLFDDALIKLQSYDIGKAIANALIKGLSDIDWNTLFKLPADALNALTNAIRGMLDSLPKNFSLANWLIEHLVITYDSIDWTGLERNLYEIGDRIVKFINDVINNDAFWNRFGDLSVRALKLVVKVTEDLTQIDWAGLAQRITDFINNIINQHKIDDIINNIGTIAINLFFTVTAVISGVDWGELGKQIAEGINKVVNNLYANKDKMKQAIIDAFMSFSTFMSNLLQDMLKNKTFAKIGTVIGEFLLGILKGIAIFFEENGTNIIKAMKQFGDSLANYIHAHRDEIIAYLSVIIDAIADIINSFFDEKGKLHKELVAIIEGLKKPIGKLIGTLVSTLIREFTEKLEDITALTDALFSVEGMSGFIEGIADAVVDFLGAILKKIWEKIKQKLNLVDILQTMGILPANGIGGFIIDLLQKAFSTKINLKNIFDKVSFAGEKEAQESLLSKAGKKIKEIWDKMPWNKNKQEGSVETEIEINPKVTIKDKDKLNLEDIVGDTELEFEDAKLGKIKTDKLEVKLFTGEKLEVDEILAETLTLTDIIADKLKVKEIETEKDVHTKKNDEYNAPNSNVVQTGTLTNPNDEIKVKVLQVLEKITAPLLEVAEKITVPLLEITEKITAPLLEITEKIVAPLLEVTEKITTPLIEADKIVTKLIKTEKLEVKTLDVEKITSKLLEAEEITNENLTSKKMKADLLEVKKMVVDVYDTDKVVLDLLDVKLLKAELLEAKKIITELLNAEKIITQLIQTAKIITDEVMAGVINAETINAVTLNVDTINAQILNVSDIFANTLNVGEINGTLSGGISGGYTGYTPTNIGYDYPSSGTLQKPTFEKGDRWSDISGLVPSAEDFLEGIEDYYNYGTGLIFDGVNNTEGWQQVNIPSSGKPTNNGNNRFTVVDKGNGITGVYDSGLYFGGSSPNASSGKTTNNGNSRFTVVDKGNGITGVYDSGMYFGGNSSNASGGSVSWNQPDGSYNTISLPSNAQYIKDYLMKAIGNEAGVYGLMGNLYAESKLLPNNLQSTSADGGVNQKDIDYTNAVNNGTQDFTDNRGYGLAQWTTNDRKGKLQDFLGNRSIDDIDGQLDYLIHELQTDFPNVWDTLKNATSNYEASTAVLEQFEKPKNASSKIDERASYSNQIAGLLGDGSQTYDIPDNPTPVSDTPKKDDDNLYTFDEANVIDDGKPTDIGEGYQWSFLDDLPLQTEYRMAEVYNIIDKWLGRIYKLFKSFKVKDFLKDLLDLEEVGLKVEGSLGIEELEELHKTLKKTNKLLEQLLKNGIKCKSEFDDSKLLEAMSEVIRTMKLLIDALEKCINAINKLKEEIEKLIGVIKNCIDIIKQSISAINKNTDALEKNTDAVKKNTEAIEKLTKALEDWLEVLEKLIESIDNLKEAVDKCTDAINKNIEALDINTEAINKCIDALNKNSDVTAVNTETLNKCIETIEKNIESLVKNTEALEKCVQALKDNTEALKNNTNALKDNTKALYAVIDALNKILDKFDKAIEALNKNTDAIYKLIGAIEKNIVALDKNTDALTKLNDNVAKLFTYFDKLFSALDKLIDVLNKIIDSLGKLSDKLEKLITSINKLVDSITNAIDALNKLKDELSKLLTAINELASAIKNNTDALNKNTDALKKLIDAINNLINTLKDLFDWDKLYNTIKKAIEDAEIHVIVDNVEELAKAIAKALATAIAEALAKATAVAEAIAVAIAGNDAHLINNTNAKSANTKAVEALTQAIYSIQGKLGSITCNCNCNCSCGNCAMGGGAGGGTGYTNTGYGNTGTGNGNTNTGYSNTNTGYGNTNGTGKGKTVHHYDKKNGKDIVVYTDGTWAYVDGGNTTTVNDPQNYAPVLQDADTGTINKPTTPQNLNNNNNNNGNTNDNNDNNNNDGGNAGGGDNNDNNKNNSTSKINYLDDEGGYHAFDNQVGVNTMSGIKGSNGKTYYNEQLIDDASNMAVTAPIVNLEELDPNSTEKGYGSIAIGSPEQAQKYGVLSQWQNIRQQLNNKVEGLRQSAGGYYNNVMTYGNESQKAQAQSAYDFLMKNQKNQWDTFNYENALKQLQIYSANAEENKYKDDKKYAVNPWFTYNGTQYRLWQLKAHAPQDVIGKAQAKFDEENNKVAEWRKDAKTKLDYINQYGTSTQKEKAKKLYDDLMIDWGVVDSSGYKSLDYEPIVAIYDNVKSNQDTIANASSLSELDSKLASVVDVGDRQWEYAVPTGNSYFYRKSAPNLNQIAEGGRQSTIDATQSVNSSNTGNFKPNLTSDEVKKAGFSSLDALVNEARKLGSKAFLYKKDYNFKSQEFPKLFAKFKDRFMAKGYQMGGIPNAGEIFVARENGTPEFVGSFGNRTAVANNDQIVTAVANGVSMANDRMVNAIEAQTNRLETAIDKKDVDVVIGDRQIAEANRRGQQGMGKKFVE